MAARVECKIGERLNVLNRIRWVKDAGWHKKMDEKILRAWLSPWEEIIFAEHYGADNIAKGEAGYGAKCDELRGFVFEPLRAYLDGERKRAGLPLSAIHSAWCEKRHSKGQMTGHWFGRSQWMLPTCESYAWLRSIFNTNGTQYLRREYEDLRREYEDLRRPFSVTADVPYTDVWDFPTVSHYSGKHPCEKPLAMMRHIITASTRPGTVVLDCFMGSGVVGEACKIEGREFIGIELNHEYYAMAERRIGNVLEMGA
jgi:site-specific DNA-methyltransferase (adenine-specific)